jgi:hypothetical protein
MKKIILIIIFIIILAIGILFGVYLNNNKSTIIESNSISDNIIGTWNCIKAIDSNNEEVTIRDIFGSMVDIGVGDLTFNSDGTFTNYIGMFSSDYDDDTTGTYTILDSIITLKPNSGNNISITYLDDDTLKYPYGDYIIILSK